MESATRWETPQEELEEPVLQGVNILAVEDDGTMLELLGHLLTEYGANVRAVASAAAALEALDGDDRYHLLLTDIGLPGMDGFELLRAVRAQHGAESLPAIAVTAFSREEDRERALASGFQAHITKPYEVAKLIGWVRKLAGGGGPAKETY